MAARNLQNVPVFDVRFKPLGILDIRDATRALFEQEEMLERMLFNYVNRHRLSLISHPVQTTQSIRQFVRPTDWPGTRSCPH